MHDHVAVINHHPALARFALLAAALVVLGAHALQRAVCQGIQHAVAGAGADHKVIGEGRYILDVQQENVLTFLVFERIDNGMGQFEWVQAAPRRFDIYNNVGNAQAVCRSGAENSLV